jgi:hypothetical protein
MTTTAVNTITTAAITPPITADFVEELCSVVLPSDDFPIKDINFYQTVLFLIVSGFFGVEILMHQLLLLLLPNTDRLKQVDDCVSANIKTSQNLSFVRYLTKPQISSEGGTTEQSSSTKSAVIGGVIAAVVIVLTAVVVVYVVCARRRRLRYYINVYVLNVNSVCYLQITGLLASDYWFAGFKLFLL